MSLMLALADARNNSKQAGATTTITLKSGEAFSGTMDTPPTPGSDTLLLHTTDGGWETIVIDEIAAVGSHR